MEKKTTIRLANILPISEANGPGAHFTIWLQGCPLKCQGCFNPNMQNFDGGKEVLISDLIQQINDLWIANRIRGVTFTGGEPLTQISSLLELLLRIKNLGNIGTIVLTGYTPPELVVLPGFIELIPYIDVLIPGRYEQELKLQEGIRGSANKSLFFFSTFYNSDEFDTIPPIEVISHLNGEISVTGIAPDLLIDFTE